MFTFFLLFSTECVPWCRGVAGVACEWEKKKKKARGDMGFGGGRRKEIEWMESQIVAAAKTKTKRKFLFGGSDLTAV